MRSGFIHIVSKHGGCEFAAPNPAGQTAGLSDSRHSGQIVASLDEYAGLQGIESPEFLYPWTKELGEWKDMADYAVRYYGIVGPALVGTHKGRRILVGATMRYGYPATNEELDDFVAVVRFGGLAPTHLLRHGMRISRRRLSYVLNDMLLLGYEIFEDVRFRLDRLLSKG